MVNQVIAVTLKQRGRKVCMGISTLYMKVFLELVGSLLELMGSLLERLGSLLELMGSLLERLGSLLERLGTFSF